MASRQVPIRDVALLVEPWQGALPGINPYFRALTATQPRARLKPYTDQPEEINGILEGLRTAKAKEGLAGV